MSLTDGPDVDTPGLRSRLSADCVLDGEANCCWSQGGKRTLARAPALPCGRVPSMNRAVVFAQMRRQGWTHIHPLLHPLLGCPVVPEEPGALAHTTGRDGAAGKTCQHLHATARHSSWIARTELHLGRLDETRTGERPIPHRRRQVHSAGMAARFKI